MIPGHRSSLPGYIVVGCQVHGFLAPYAEDIASNLLLPLGGLALAIFAGWIIPARLLEEELSMSSARVALLGVVLRYIVPLAIAAVLIAALVF